MGLSLIPPELTLDCSISSNTSWVPKTTVDFLAEVSKIQNASEKILKLDDYVHRLQDEMKKIDAFKRELPLCMLLLNDAIATVKEELMRCKNSNAEPIMEEFIPLKEKRTDETDEKVEGSKENDIITNSRDKMNWMSSVQGGTELSLCTPEIKSSKEEIYTNGFSSKSSSGRSGSSSATNGQSNVKAEQQQTNRKQRRCWSAELHRRFVSALEHLGGPQAATPKQIRELMQVDGLTNDEVKSHLQKYRLHTRKIPPTANTSTVQPVMLGGLWMSQEHCGESLKLSSNSQSGSPQGPINLTGSSRVTSMSGGYSAEEEDDEKSESHSWKSQNHLTNAEDKFCPGRDENGRCLLRLGKTKHQLLSTTRSWST
ncbi:hypothetical protein DH2020_023861 [Rehmannia glutinosa]|uniref:HTH myb-type domain-containing protein n=1 Tax=Rehmannia glutinosa TaxID=99300 RepID=A0ABR0W777_REHGL